LRWTVDQPADFVLVETIYGELYPTNPAFTTADILALIKRRPELATINAGFTRADGLKPSEVADTAFLAARAAARQ
jgi:spore coat polysaccharide biosynthesis protein SpsF